MKKYRRGERIPLDELMKIAGRNKLARFEWSLYKSVCTNTHMFSLNYSEWTPAQKLFVYWNEFFDSVNESMDRPPERVIQDDELLEKWLKRQSEESKQRAEANWNKTGALHQISSAYDHNEIVTFGEEEE
jgi:hypothetical protein